MSEAKVALGGPYKLGFDASYGRQSCSQDATVKDESLNVVRIDNSSSLETWAQEQDSSPDPRFPWATCLCSPEVEPPQADTKNVGPYGKTGQTKGINPPNGGLIKAPNGGTKMATISFMNLKSKLVANQELSLEGGTGLQPDPMTTTLEQDNQVANLRFLINERTPGPSAILPP
ncbi:hypothetical protein DSO57_1013923 [Entomophthora muscae]|uniref:Uncharacterized protein n=1 Tax=Entomophthora muscae TaxID=34485 RepID=A0ACC2URX0_9FUNG|nr:hypothetical protein DSO57_1013923 [Entomophthora muscae]